ncbi:MAG TPA: hypothetical protein VGM32_17640 [Rhodopila sp.]|jgi:hypothetical protein
MGKICFDHYFRAVRARAEASVLMPLAAGFLTASRKPREVVGKRHSVGEQAERVRENGSHFCADIAVKAFNQRSTLFGSIPLEQSFMYRLNGSPAWNSLTFGANARGGFRFRKRSMYNHEHPIVG